MKMSVQTLQQDAELDVSLRLREAMLAHQQHRFADAERAYNAVLDVAPDRFEALHFLGLAYLQQHKLSQALDLVTRALKVKPGAPDSLAMRGVALSHLGRYAEALEAQEAVLALQPDSAETHYNRGISLSRLGRHEEAIPSYRKSLALEPGKTEAFHNLGNSLVALNRMQEALDAFSGVADSQATADILVNRGQALLELNRNDEALKSYESALARTPDSITALLGRAQTLRALERNEDALACFDRVLALDPAHLDAMGGKSAVLHTLERHAEALDCCDLAYLLAPERLDVLSARCVALQHLGRFEESEVCARRALEIDPENGTAHFNLGGAYYGLGRYDEAETAIRRAIELSPETSSGYKNLGGALLALEQHDKALESLGRALELCPQNEDTRTNRGLVYLGLGDFTRGWAEYHLRFASRSRKEWRDYPSPLWDGGPLDEPLVVWGEQGLGDQILYASMINDLRARVPAIVIEAEKRLVPLFARSFPDVEVRLATGELYAGPQAAHIPFGTLGQHLRTSWDSFLASQTHFLVADPERTAALRARLKIDDRLVIGLSWRSANKKFEKAKSAGLSAFEPLLALPNCRFVDLQYGDTSAERDYVAQETGIRVEHLDDIDNTSDIDGLAALMTACDLVVTVSNTTAHLAGALGKETHVLVPFGQARMWYWFHERADTPFYPSIRIHRQTKTHDWATMMPSLAAEIAGRRGA